MTVNNQYLFACPAPCTPPVYLNLLWFLLLYFFCCCSLSHVENIPLRFLFEYKNCTSLYHVHTMNVHEHLPTNKTILDRESNNKNSPTIMWKDLLTTKKEIKKLTITSLYSYFLQACCSRASYPSHYMLFSLRRHSS